MSNDKPRERIPTLLDEPPILVYPSLAAALGSSDKAIILQQVHFLLQAARVSKNKYNEVGNRWWVYNTYEEWRDTHFPWLSTPTIKRIFNSLEADGLILSMQGVKDTFDRRKWYSIDYDALDEYVRSMGSKRSDEKGSNCADDMGSKRSHVNKETETPTETPSENIAPNGAWAGFFRILSFKVTLHVLHHYLDSRRDQVFEAVCLQLFGIEYTDVEDRSTRGRIAGVSKTIRANFEARYDDHFGGGWTPDLTGKCARSVEEFVKYWRREKPNTSLPLAREKVGTEYLRFLQGYNGTRPTRPAPAESVAPELTPEQIEEMRAVRQATRPAWETGK